MARHIRYPTSWDSIDLSNATWSDRRLWIAFAKAIEERQHASGRAVGDVYRLFTGDSIETANRITRNPLLGYGSSSTYLREYASILSAQCIRSAIIGLMDGFIDMEWDYSTRDWYEFPRTLKDLWDEKDTGHPMALEPAPNDGEVVGGNDSALSRFRVFVSDCKWWLDRMSCVRVGTSDYRFTSLVELSQSYDHYPDGSESGSPIASGIAVRSVSEGVYNGRDIETLRGLRIGLSKSASRNWPDNGISEHEEAGRYIYRNLKVRNRSAFKAYLGLVVKNGGFTGGGGRSLTSTNFSQSNTSESKEWFRYEDGTEHLSTSYECNGTTYTQTDTTWNRDFSDSVSETTVGLCDVSQQTPSRSEGVYAPLPGIYYGGVTPYVFGANRNVASINPGEISSPLYEFNTSTQSVLLPIPSWLTPPTPPPATAYNRIPSSRRAWQDTSCVIPFLDFSRSFRFKPDDESSSGT